MMIKAGMVERLKIKVAATAIGTAGAIVASRAVATAPKIAAVDPCAQLVRIQKLLTRKTASAARTPVHSAPNGSFAWVVRGCFRRESEGFVSLGIGGQCCKKFAQSGDHRDAPDHFLVRH
jgi:hypothetical protein